MPKVTKVRAGKYAVEVNGHTFYAIRNEAGFAGRDWYITDENEHTIDDMIGSKSEAVEYILDVAGSSDIPSMLAALAAENGSN